MCDQFDQLRDQRSQGPRYWPPFAPWVHDRSPGAGHRSGRLSQGALPVSGMPWGYASVSVAAS
jgi:hypothetical protein